MLPPAPQPSKPKPSRPKPRRNGRFARVFTGFSAVCSTGFSRKLTGAIPPKGGKTNGLLVLLSLLGCSHATLPSGGSEAHRRGGLYF